MNGFKLLKLAVFTTIGAAIIGPPWAATAMVGLWLIAWAISLIPR